MNMETVFINVIVISSTIVFCERIPSKSLKCPSGTQSWNIINNKIRI